MNQLFFQICESVNNHFLMDQTLIQRSTKELIGPQHIICNLIGTEEEERQFKRIIDSDDYKSASSFREQVFILCNQLRSNDAPISFERVGRVFGKSKQAIWSQYKKSLQGTVMADQLSYHLKSYFKSRITLASFILIPHTLYILLIKKLQILFPYI